MEACVRLADCNAVMKLYNGVHHFTLSKGPIGAFDGISVAVGSYHFWQRKTTCFAPPAAPPPCAPPPFTPPSQPSPSPPPSPPPSPAPPPPSTPQQMMPQPVQQAVSVPVQQGVQMQPVQMQGGGSSFSLLDQGDVRASDFPPPSSCQFFGFHCAYLISRSGSSTTIASGKSAPFTPSRLRSRLFCWRPRGGFIGICIPPRSSIIS